MRAELPFTNRGAADSYSTAGWSLPDLLLYPDPFPSADILQLQPLACIWIFMVPAANT